MLRRARGTPEGDPPARGRSGARRRRPRFRPLTERVSFPAPRRNILEHVVGYPGNATAGRLIQKLPHIQVGFLGGLEQREPPFTEAPERPIQAIVLKTQVK